MPKKPEKPEILETLLRQLLQEVQVRDALGKISTQRCAGCLRSKPHVRACVAARHYLDHLEYERAAEKRRLERLSEKMGLPSPEASAPE